MKRIIFFALLGCIFAQNVQAKEHVIDLTVAYKTVNFAGKERCAIAVNDQIPAPTLHFKQGDHVKINVHNKLDKDTAIHWHGIILPWQMDGVEGVNQKGIMPGKTFTYEFTLEQSGTYWYHAHAGLQEQEGLYGAFVIDPPENNQFQYSKDFAIVLSDWSNTNSDQIFANLKKEGDYYSPNFPLQPSLAKFIRDYSNASCKQKKTILDDYKMMQQMRMSFYDYSDVAYDAFLLNGQTKCKPWTGLVKVGDVVRLRFIGAGASTIFKVKIPDANMQMVHVQGNDVQPYPIKDFTIAPGETYDVLVKIEKNKPYIIYAESSDTVGVAYGALITDANQKVNYNKVAPFPEPIPVTQEMMTMMMAGMDDNSMSMNMPMEHSSKNNQQKQTNNKMPKGMNHSMHNMNSQNMQQMNMNNSSSAPKESTMQHDMQMNATEGKENPSQTKTAPMDMSSDAQKNQNMPMDHSMHNMSSQDMQQMNMNNSSSVPKESKMQHDKQMNATQGKENTKQPTTESMDMNPDEQKDQNMSMDHSMHKMNMGDGNSKSGETSVKTNKMEHPMLMGAQNMTSQHMSHTTSMNSGSMDMPTEPSIFVDTISTPTSPFTTPGTKYQNLIAAVKTNDPNIPVTGEIKMELFGYMDRYIWFINGKPEYEVMPYILEPGKRYRFVFTNNSMMHHPMHIHGHWFILRKGNGEYDPLLHTIDVAPGATITADVDTDASGQWFFHCHMLYHMFAGMARVFQYSTLFEVTQNKMQPQNTIKQSEFVNRPIVRVDEVRPIDKALVKHPMAHPMVLFLANFLDVGFDPSHNAQKLNFRGLYGQDYNKLELFINDAEMNKGKIENADLDIFYWHLLNQFWAIKAGANYFYRPADVPYWQPGIGIEGLAPYFIDVDFRAYYHKGSAKFDLELSRDCQITNNFILRAAIRGIGATKTVSRAQIGSGLNQMRYIIRPYYRIAPGFNVFAEYEYERNYGAYKNLQTIAGEPKVQNTVTLGIGIVF